MPDIGMTILQAIADELERLINPDDPIPRGHTASEVLGGEVHAGNHASHYTLGVGCAIYRSDNPTSEIPVALMTQVDNLVMIQRSNGEEYYYEIADPSSIDQILALLLDILKRPP